MEFEYILILFAAGCIAGFINVVAGGGSAITLPVLIFLGLDASVANGTNRVAIFLQNISAVYSFKQEKYFHFKKSFRMGLAAIPGALAGAIFAVDVSNETLETIIGIIMILIVFSMVIPRKKRNEFNSIEDQPTIWTYLALFFSGFYGGFIQIGVGYILMSVLHNIQKLNLIYVNMHKVLIVLLYTIPALVVFFITGKVDLFLGIILSAGNIIGAWWAAKFTIKKGEKFIKIILFVSISFMAFKLLKVF